MPIPDLPPGCLSEFVCERIDRALAGLPSTVNFNTFALCCPCGNRTFGVLGYWLPPAAASVKAEFTGPLSASCISCGRIEELFDAERDGYDGEIGGSCVTQGTGLRMNWNCSACKLNEGELVASFGYQFAFEQVDELATRPQDFFDAFILTHLCLRSRTPIEIATFECA